MSKIEIIEDLSSMINDLRDVISDLNICIDKLKNVFNEDQFIPENLSREISQKLQKANEIQGNFTKGYLELNGDNLPLTIKSAEESLADNLEKATEEEKFKEIFNYFLRLYSNDPGVEAALEKEQKEVKDLLNSEFDEPDRLPQALNKVTAFMSAFCEEDKDKKYQKSMELRQYFDDGLILGLAFGQISMFDTENAPYPKQEEILDDQDLGKNQNNNTVTWDDLGIENPEDLVIEEKTDLLQVSRSEKAQEKFGVSRFKNDMSKQPVKLRINIFVLAYQWGGITAGAASSWLNIDRGLAESALEKISHSGYMDIYTTDLSEKLYCVNLRGSKAFAYKESVQFMNQYENVKIDRDEKNEIKDSMNAALARICILDSERIEAVIGDDGIIKCSLSTRNEHAMRSYEGLRGNLNVTFVSIVSDNVQEFCDLKESIQELDQDRILIVIGKTEDNALNLGLWIKGFMGDNARIFCVGFAGDDLIDPITGEGKHISRNLFKNYSEQTEDKAVPETERRTTPETGNEAVSTTGNDEAISETEDEVAPETGNEVVSVREEKTVPETEGKTVPETEDKNPVSDINLQEFKNSATINDTVQGAATDTIDEEIANIRETYLQMLCEGKYYVAMSYIRAASQKYEEMKTECAQLAYALNDPIEKCTYSSEQITHIFQDSQNTTNDFFETAATLRTDFMSQYSYNYPIPLSNPVLSANPPLNDAIYMLREFKKEQNCGIDKYADYHAKERMNGEKRLSELQQEAKGYYESYVAGSLKGKASNNKRYSETRKLLFSQTGDIGEYLQIIINHDNSMLEYLKDFACENFIKDGTSICVKNIDNNKIDHMIDNYWNQACQNVRPIKKNSKLMGNLRVNLFNLLKKIFSVMAEYVDLTEIELVDENDRGFIAYKKNRDELIQKFREASGTIKRGGYSTLPDIAGKNVLDRTLVELISRLDGSYSDLSEKYFYIDFLKNDEVLLDEEYFPVLEDVPELPEISSMNRIEKHAMATEFPGWYDRLDSIFAGQDDYGSAKLITQYLLNVDSDETTKERLSKYNTTESSRKYLLQGLDKKRKEFAEDLELAQSYGKIDNAQGDRKEAIMQIVDRWYVWAKETYNIGFFVKILNAFHKQIEEGASIRSIELKSNLNSFIEQNPSIKEDADSQKIVNQIQTRIDKQNYAAAEDLLNRLVSNDILVDSDPIISEDYFQQFLNEYDSNYKATAHADKNLRLLTQGNNKNIKGARRLIDNWSKGVNGIQNLLEALGFQVAEVKTWDKIQGKYENYVITLKQPTNGRKSNYKHPIAAFGSEAEAKGFRVVCLYGQWDADNLIDICKVVGNAKHTLIFLDWALNRPERQKLARVSKSQLNSTIFAVIDRVVIMYLANHYSETAINRMLMSVVMPYTYYQPYIDKSVDVMPQEMFMGRQNELEEIKSPRGVNIVCGGRQLGKSALLRMAEQEIDKDENGDRAIYVEIKGKDYKQAAKKISEVLYDQKVLKIEHITEDWDELARDIMNRLRDEKDPIPYLLLMLDEADAFIESSESINYQPFDALKQIQSIGQERFKFVVAGLRNIVRFKREAALGNNSVIAQLGRSLTVKPFKSAEARELLEVPLYYLGFRFEDDSETDILVSTILGTTNYFPGLLQLYCKKMIEAMKKDYGGYSETDTPPYMVKEELIKKVLAEQDLQEEIRNKFYITLKEGDDDYYYILALIVAYLYHQDKNQNGSSVEDICSFAREYGITKIANLDSDSVYALLEEMRELNVLQLSANECYRFTRNSFCQMMGTSAQLDEELMNYME